MQKEYILQTDATLPNMLEGTLNEPKVNVLIGLLSYLSIWLFSKMLISSFQWISDTMGNNGCQIFDTIRMAQINQEDPL